MSGNVQRFIVLLSPRDRLLLDLVAGHYQRSRGDTLRVLVRQAAAGVAQASGEHAQAAR